MNHKAVVFDEYFGLGEEESASPFLTPFSRQWAVNLSLKASIVAAFLLLLSFILSFQTNFLSISNFLLVSVYFLAGVPSLIGAIEDLMALDVNIDVLMTLAAFGSILIGSSMEGALLLVLFSLSGSIEDAVTSKAKGSINFLQKVSPTKAYVIEKDGRTVERSVKDITIGTKLLVKSGELVPLDGKIIEGASHLNLAHLTGESVPISKRVGDEVPAGAKNMEGFFVMEATRTNVDSTFSRIIRLITQAQEAKPKLQRWFDRLSKGYAIAIISLAFLFAFALPYLFQIPYLGHEGSIYRSLAFLIAASPCALIIAIPIAYLSAVSACARKGILLKGGTVLDALAHCSIIAFDKTGTLTTGQLTIEQLFSIFPADSTELNAALAIAYSLEKNAVHPIAKAIVTFAEKKEVKAIAVKNFQAIPGYGLEALVNWKGKEEKAFMGLPVHILEKLSPETRKILEKKIDILEKQEVLLSLLLIGDTPFLFTFQDDIRPNVQEVVRSLHAEKIKLVMLTGDHEKNAQRVARLVGIDDYYANLRPEDKLDHVSRLAKENGLAMVGDGVNDAPALARATVGICMGKVGSGTAIEAAEVILLNDNLERLDWLMLKAKKTKAIVTQNLAIATIAILIASLPALAGFVPLWLAVIMHEGGTVLVGLNGLRLLK